MFDWTEEGVRFRRDAAEYADFDAALAERLLPHLSPAAHVCDAGCGLGYLSLALAKRCARVTAVDQSAAALAVLRENAAQAGAENLTIIEGDLFSMQPEARYDAMVFCFFGGIEETLRAVRAQCAGKALLIKKASAVRRFARADARSGRLTFQQTCEGLSARGIPFTTETFTLEMGQPFRASEDALRFFSLYSRGSTPPSPAEIERRLVPIKHARFRYYLPAALPLGLIVLNAVDVPAPLE